MRTLSRNDTLIMEQLITRNQEQTASLMRTFLKSKYNKVIEEKEYICAVGNIPVVLLAHMDTVSDTRSTQKELYYDKTKNVMWSPHCAGFDDKAGIFAIIKIIQSGLRPHILFTTDEEVGGLGAYAFTLDENPFEDIRYMIQLDRRGRTDCVFYDCDNPSFVEYVESFGFIETWGTFSDISTIAPELKVAAVNLSVGYFDEHSENELLDVSALLKTIDRVKMMLNEDFNKVPQFIYIPAVSKYLEDAYAAWGLDGLSPTEEDICDICHGPLSYKSGTMIKNLVKGTYDFICPECVNKYVSWCERCGTAFIKREGHTEYLCKDCEEEVLV